MSDYSDTLPGWTANGSRLEHASGARVGRVADDWWWVSGSSTAQGVGDTAVEAAAAALGYAIRNCDGTGKNWDWYNVTESAPRLYRRAEQAALAALVHHESRATAQPVCKRCGAAFAAAGHCSRREQGCQGGRGEVAALSQPESAALRPAEWCKGCPHPPHLGDCNRRNGGTAYQCPCIYSTPPWCDTDRAPVAEPPVGEVRTLPSGYELHRQPNEAGGHTYTSNEVGGGVLVWDTCCVDERTLQAALAWEREAAPPSPAAEPTPETVTCTHCDGHGRVVPCRAHDCVACMDGRPQDCYWGEPATPEAPAAEPVPATRPDREQGTPLGAELLKLRGMFATAQAELAAARQECERLRAAAENDAQVLSLARAERAKLERWHGDACVERAEARAEAERLRERVRELDVLLNNATHLAQDVADARDSDRRAHAAREAAIVDSGCPAGWKPSHTRTYERYEHESGARAWRSWPDGEWLASGEPFPGKAMDAHYATKAEAMSAALRTAEQTEEPKP